MDSGKPSVCAVTEAEHALVAANRDLITRFEQKFQATLARISGEDKEKAESVILQ